MGDFESIIQTSWPILLMVVIFYFLLYRPQKKQQKQRDTLLNSLKKGQKVVTVGGLYGEIVDLDGETVSLEVADKTVLKFSRASIGSLVVKHKDNK